MDGPGPALAVPGPHEEIFNSAFDLWIGRKNVSYDLCSPISIHKVLRALGMRQLRVEHISILWQEVAMKHSRVLPRKHGMSALMLALKEAEVKEEAIPVQINQGNKETQQLKDNNKTHTVMVHTGYINKTTTLPLPIEEKWRQATS